MTRRLWTLSTGAADRIVAPDERLPWPQTAAMGLQHLVAMFGSTVLAPLLMGIDPNTAILMSGAGTLLFFALTAGRVPSYLGSSFSFIAVVIAVTGYGGMGGGAGPNTHLPVALGGIVLCGLAYALIGVAVQIGGTAWIERLMPPVVTGSIVVVIGLNLATGTVRSLGARGFDGWMAAATALCIAIIGTYGRGMLRRLSILAGLTLASLLAVLAAALLGLPSPVDGAAVRSAPWLGPPRLTAPVFTLRGALLIVPVAVILVAENLGHLKAVAAMTGRNLDRFIGRAFLADGLATMASGAVGGAGVTTYAENIGVMAATRIYSTAAFVAAGLFAIGLGFSPKFGAVIAAIPHPVMGGAAIVVFGLITVAGARIWIDNRVDLSRQGNLFVVAITVMGGTGDFTLRAGSLSLGGIGTATFGAIVLNALLNRGAPSPVPQDQHRMSS